MRTETDRTRDDGRRKRDSKWHGAALTTDAVGRSLKETAGSAMNIVMKLVVLLGFLAIQWMLLDAAQRLDWGHHLRLLHSGRSAVFCLEGQTNRVVE